MPGTSSAAYAGTLSIMPPSSNASPRKLPIGVNGGVGVYAVLSPPVKLYLEARYHYIWGPGFTTPDGERHDADGQYIPLVGGFAF